MLTRTGQRNLYGQLTSGTANAANLSFGDTIIDSETRRLLAKTGGNPIQVTGTASTRANQQAYELPNKLKKLRTVTITVGTYKWPVKRSPSRAHWDSVNIISGTAYTSNYPEWFYVIGRKVNFFPTPSSGSAVIEYDYDKRLPFNSIDDYTTGTVTQVTSGSTTILGSTTSWSTAMVGRFMQISKSNTVTNNGDGEFYEVASVTSNTALDLTKNYEGQTITSGGASYLIGEISPLPDGFHELPVYRAAQIYYTKNDQNRFSYFKQLGDGLEAELLGANDPNESVTLEETDEYPVNPNFYPQNLQ